MNESININVSRSTAVNQSTNPWINQQNHESIDNSVERSINPSLHRQHHESMKFCRSVHAFVLRSIYINRINHWVFILNNYRWNRCRSVHVFLSNSIHITSIESILFNFQSTLDQPALGVRPTEGLSSLAPTRDRLDTPPPPTNEGGPTGGGGRGAGPGTHSPC